MKWTADLPESEGWYLYRNDYLHTEHAYYVSKAPKGGFYIGAARESRGQKLKPEQGALWAGPIPDPDPYDGPDITPGPDRRNKYLRICSHCGKEFFSLRDVKFCSAVCAAMGDAV